MPASSLDGSPQQMPWERTGRRHRSGPPAPIVEVNAMHPTSPAMPDVMICGRAAQWLPRLAERLIAAADEHADRQPSLPRQTMCDCEEGEDTSLSGGIGRIQLD